MPVISLIIERRPYRYRAGSLTTAALTTAGAALRYTATRTDHRAFDRRHKRRDYKDAEVQETEHRVHKGPTIYFR